jgi:hypothetical protein
MHPGVLTKLLPHNPLRNTSVRLSSVPDTKRSNFNQSPISASLIHLMEKLSKIDKS